MQPQHSSVLESDNNYLFYLLFFVFQKEELDLSPMATQGKEQTAEPLLQGTAVMGAWELCLSLLK